MGSLLSKPGEYHQKLAWRQVRKQQWEDHKRNERRYYEEQRDRYRNARADGTSLTNDGVDYSGGRQRKARFPLD